MLRFLGIFFVCITKPVVDLKVNLRFFPLCRHRCRCCWCSLLFFFPSHYYYTFTTDPMTMSDRDRESQSTVTTNHMCVISKSQLARFVCVILRFSCVALVRFASYETEEKKSADFFYRIFFSFVYDDRFVKRTFTYICVNQCFSHWIFAIVSKRTSLGDRLVAVLFSYRYDSQFNFFFTSLSLLSYYCWHLQRHFSLYGLWPPEQIEMTTNQYTFFGERSRAPSD